MQTDRPLLGRRTDRPLLDTQRLADELDLLGMKARTLAMELRAANSDPLHHERVHMDRALAYLLELQTTVQGVRADAVPRWSRG